MGEQGVVRMNVSVPRELKERMDRISEAVNWSAIASRAFETKLLELQSQREGKNMRDVIARLKAAAELEANEEYQGGKEGGAAWAKGQATPRQLRSLKELAEDQYGIEGQLEIYTNGMNRGIAQGLAEDLNRAQHIDGQDWWERVLGDEWQRIEDKDFARGFMEGALEVWEAVEDEL